MKKQVKVLSLVAIAIVGVALLSGNAHAYQGDPQVKGPYYSEERHEAILKAFEENNYQGWKALMQGKGRVAEVVNSQNFARFAQAHKLMLAGKTEEASKIKEELGLGLHNGLGKGYGRVRGKMSN